MTQKEAKKCRALTYESWKTVEFIDDLYLPGLSSVSWPASLAILSVPVFLPESFSSYPPSPPPAPPPLSRQYFLSERSLGLEDAKMAAWQLYSLVKICERKHSQQSEDGIVLFFCWSPVESLNTFLNIWINKLFEKWRFWWVLLLNLFNLLAHISV